MAADRQTDTHTQKRVTTIYFVSSTTHAKCNNAFLSHGVGSGEEKDESTLIGLGILSNLQVASKNSAAA